MSTPRIQITNQAEGEAHRRDQPLAAGAVLLPHASVAPGPADASTPDEVRSLFEGLPRRDPADLREIAAAQGVGPVRRLEDLPGDFSPEEESEDEFLAWLRKGRQDPSSEAGR